MPTPHLRVMRRLHAPPPPSAWALATLVLAALFLWPVASHAQTAELGGLEQLARDFVAPAMKGSIAPAGEAPLRPEVVVGTLDTRLRLAPCNKVEAHLPTGTRLWGRSRIGLRCVDGPTRWNVFVPVTVKAWGPAWVLRHPVASGATLSQDDAEMAEIDWAEQPASVLASPALWVGRQAAYSLQPGQALRQNMVRAAPAFAAGAMVKVSSAGTGFQVVVTGEAMAPGIEGQPTRVRLPGGKVVSGLVRDAQTVEIDL
ncbi:MAG: flagellar basal body P-ring formation chaperone FlgA [Hydrogenophaga sp.]|uniref:flagellar basal body P-ring formation chaperone FlgA n=1 Tax=Hydrogenophaga sp. TaxID=1904254 RepID=UPI003D9AB62B